MAFALKNNFHCVSYQHQILRSEICKIVVIEFERFPETCESQQSASIQSRGPGGGGGRKSALLAAHDQPSDARFEVDS